MLEMSFDGLHEILSFFRQFILRLISLFPLKCSKCYGHISLVCLVLLKVYGNICVVFYIG